MFTRAAAIAGVLVLATATTASATPTTEDQPLIIGGTLASTTEASWAIALTNTAGPAPTGRWCGAVLVRANKLITAAHCMAQPAGTYTAVQGRADLRDWS